RERFFSLPFYRLVHSEADGLPGLVIDRFNDRYVLQSTTAGMERLIPFILESLQRDFSARSVVLRNDVSIRSKEGLPEITEVIGEEITGPIQVREHDTRYLANLLTGQKTGWFFDQRANRAHLASLCRDKTVLDLYAHS